MRCESGMYGRLGMVLCSCHVCVSVDDERDRVVFMVRKKVSEKSFKG